MSRSGPAKTPTTAQKRFALKIVPPRRHRSPIIRAGFVYLSTSTDRAKLLLESRGTV